MRELAIKLGIVCSILMVLALFMSINAVSNHKSSQATVLNDQNSSTHYSSQSLTSAIIFAAEDPEYTGSVQNEDVSFEPRALVKFSSGWSINRSSKTDKIIRLSNASY